MPNQEFANLTEHNCNWLENFRPGGFWLPDVGSLDSLESGLSVFSVISSCVRQQLDLTLPSALVIKFNLKQDIIDTEQDLCSMNKAMEHNKASNSHNCYLLSVNR